MDLTATQTTPAASRLTRGYAICLVGTVLWSSTAVFIRYLTDTYHMPPLVLAFWRDALVCLALLGVMAVFTPARIRPERRHLAFLALFGLELSLFNASWTISVGLNGAAVSTVLAYSSAAFTALLGWRLFAERLGLSKGMAVVLSLLGCGLVSGAYDPAAWRLNPVGVATGLFSGLAFAAYSLMGKAAARRGLDPWTTLLYTFGCGAFFLLAYNQLPALLPGANAAPNLLWLGDAWLGWLVLFALAIGPTIGGYGLYTVSLGYLPASVANLIATLEPAMTAILAYLFLSERLTGVQLAGSILILAGVVLLRMSEGRLRNGKAPQGIAVG